jgi:2-dehydropantoate 2-reductase
VRVSRQSKVREESTVDQIGRVAILGAGAVGAVYASKFLEAAGFSTAVVARGERHDRLVRDGLVVNGKPYALAVLHPDQVTTPADLIIVALKHHQLPAAVPDLRLLVGRQTTILSVMNGLDSEEVIGAAYGMDRVLYAMVVGIDAVRQGNAVTYTRAGKLFFGEAVNTDLSPRVQCVQEALARAGILYETPPDMIRMLWWKFMINVGLNPASMVMRAPYGVFQSSPEAQALMEDLMREVVVLAQAAGVNLTEQDVADWYPFLDSMSPQGKSSMLQDVEAGRRTEAEMFGGKVVELGRRYGIPTPVNQALLHIVRVLEQAGGERGA